MASTLSLKAFVRSVSDKTCSRRPEAPGITGALRRAHCVANFTVAIGDLITATGGDLAAFGSAARLATYAGLAPAPNGPGRCSGVLHRPERYHRRLRHLFYMAAFSSLQREGPSRTFYQRKRAERQRHTKAMIALARRLVDVLWAMLRDNKPWTAPIPATTTA
jgi:hypothetical protein